MATVASAIGPTIQHPEPTGRMTDGAIPAPKFKSGFWRQVTNQSGASSWNPPVSFMPSPALASAFPNDGARAPRTQKVTLRSRQWSVRTAGWRAVARCHGQRDAVPDDDLVVADEDFLDEKPQDALAFQDLEGPRRRPQSRKERGQRFSEAPGGCAGD